MIRTAAALALALSSTACTKDEPPAEPPAAEETAGEAADAPAEEAAEKPAEAPAEPAGHPVWGAYDIAAELARLDGTWQVRTQVGGRTADTWKVEGGLVTITKPDGTTEAAKLVMPMPGQLGVKSGNSTSYYAYARDGESLWIGLGDGGVKVGDRYLVAADRGMVAFDGAACAFHKKKMSFGGGATEFEVPVEVKCALQEAGEQTVLHYQTPRFMKEGEFEDHQIAVRGTALMNEQLQKEHAVTPGAPEAAK